MLLHLTNSDPDLIQSYGWERAYTDKLGRSQTKDSGPNVFTILGAAHSRCADWLVEAIRRHGHPYPNFPRTDLSLDPAA
jgi:hypothetical protein